MIFQSRPSYIGDPYFPIKAAMRMPDGGWLDSRLEAFDKD